MPTIHTLTEANKLTLPFLLRGVLEAIRKRGLPDFFALLPFKSFEGSTYDFNWELTNPSSASVIDPYSTSDLPEGVGTRQRVNVITKALGRNVDTAIIDTLGKSNINNIRMQDMRDAAKTFTFDFAQEAIRGMGRNNHANGIDYWVDYWVDNGYTDQDYDAGTAVFSSQMLYDMLLRTKMESFDVIFADRQTTVEFRALLAELPGNVPMHIMDPRFGKPMLMFDGIPWVVLDSIAEDKALVNAVVAGTGTTITAAVTDNGFVGFSNADVGKVVSDGSNTSTISSVDFSTGVATISGSITDGTKNLTVLGPDSTGGAATKRNIYAVRFDEGDGFTSVYHANPNGTMPDNGEFLGGSLAGFSARNIGELQGPGILRSRMDWYGNFASHLPYSIVRLRNFTFPS